MKKIKDLPKVDRPREKLLKYGVSRLKDEELLAIILGSGTKNKNAVRLSKNILSKFKKDLVNTNLKELNKINGLGPAKSSKIVACFELSKRLIYNKKSTLYLNPKDIYNDLKDIRGSKKEHFIVFYLDSRNQEIKREVVSIGTLNSTLVHPREVFEPAVKYLAAQLIIAHNHPSGDLKPSKEDLELTKKLKEAGKILGIEVTDHIIVSDSNFYSFKENNLF